MSRREYDFENGDTTLDSLMKAINEQKANFGGDSMYIELARKFDNSDYQWVCYRDKLHSETYGSPVTTGYFVLFKKDGTVLKSISFSYPYLCHSLAQCNMVISGTAGYAFCYLFVTRGPQVRYNYIDIYGNTVTLYRGRVTDVSDITIMLTSSGSVGNFVTDNTFISLSGTSMQWVAFSNSSYNGPTYLTVTANITSKTLTQTGIGRTNSNFFGQLLCCTQSSSYKWVTWPTSNATTGISYSTSTTPISWTRSTTAVSPYANRYNSIFYFPIWSWTHQTDSPTDVSKNNLSLWWRTNDGYLERKFMLQSNISSLTPSSTLENQDYYRIKNGSTYDNYVTAFGLMTMDGRIIYTMNINTKLIEKIDTKVR